MGWSRCVKILFNDVFFENIRNRLCNDRFKLKINIWGWCRKCLYTWNFRSNYYVGPKIHRMDLHRMSPSSKLVFYEVRRDFRAHRIICLSIYINYSVSELSFGPTDILVLEIKLILVIWPDPTHESTHPSNHPYTHPWVGESSQMSNLQTELKYLNLY